MDALVIGMGKGGMDSGNEICLPVKSVEVEGESPAVGDSVDFSASGKVSRVEGGNVYLSLEKVNGEPLPKADSSDDESSEEDNLRNMAQKKDESEGMDY